MVLISEAGLFKPKEKEGLSNYLKMYVPTWDEHVFDVGTNPPRPIRFDRTDYITLTHVFFFLFSFRSIFIIYYLSLYRALSHLTSRSYCHLVF